MELIIPEGIRILSEPQSHASLDLSMDSLFLYEQGKRWICVSEVDPSAKVTEHEQDTKDVRQRTTPTTSGLFAIAYASAEKSTFCSPLFLLRIQFYSLTRHFDDGWAEHPTGLKDIKTTRRERGEMSFDIDLTLKRLANSAAPAGEAMDFPTET